MLHNNSKQKKEIKIMRLDNYIFQNGHTSSRNKAKELIVNGKVLVDGELSIKPSLEVEDVEIIILQDIVFVGRGGDKLHHFLKEVEVEIEDKVCLDIGSSTGGFIEVLLLNKAKEVVGVDVGTNQLHQTLLDNPKVKSIEKTDIRKFSSEEKFPLVTCDVSFVGIEHILEDIDRLSSDKIIILFKPQYEVGRDVKRDKKGVVKDQNAIRFAKIRFESSCFKIGWELLEQRESTIKGKEGNVEIFYYFKK